MSHPYRHAQDSYAELGLNTGQAIQQALALPIALHCWQVDDVSGFEVKEGPVAGGGIMDTGDYTGRARTPAEASQDYEQALKRVTG